ncbi:MAG: FAD:protein FMN transferase [Candidatus Tantalella remota]|nr:FAD:protein FMN transferase [Candidatus Tantalella remota]
MSVMMVLSRSFFAGVAVIALLVAGCSRPASAPSEYFRTVPLMNTFVEIKVASDDFTRERLAKAVDESIELAGYLERKFNVFDPDSEVNQLNLTRIMNVSEDLYSVIKEAQRISRLTGGEFDITVAPALKADGFYKDMPENLKDKIPEVDKDVTWRDVFLSPEGEVVALEEGVWVDLSGIAKGYIVDRVSDFLRDAGIDRYLVNAGGDMFCGGKPDSKPWRIGVRKPAAETVTATLSLRGTAVATSGDYENVVFDEDTGVTVAHIIDPATEKPVPEVPSSVTVIAFTCTEADALATGMMAMGAEKAMVLADSEEDVEIIVVGAPGDPRVVRFSAGAEKYRVR